MAKEAVQDNAGRLKALQATIDKIEKDYGKGTIMKLGDQPQYDVQVIPSGSVALDHALGIGGYPRGRIIEIYGPESSGKTTLAIHAIAQAQKQGGIAAMIDAEHAFDRTYAKALGVDLDTLLISQPDNGEQALEIADNLIRSGAIDIIVIDSVAALTPKAEIEGEMGDNKVGLQARLMSQALRKLTANISTAYYPVSYPIRCGCDYSPRQDIRRISAERLPDTRFWNAQRATSSRTFQRIYPAWDRRSPHLSAKLCRDRPSRPTYPALRRVLLSPANPPAPAVLSRPFRIPPD